MHIVFLDSWRARPHEGSGTTVGISGLAAALKRAGHRVELVRRARGSGSLPSRVAFNLAVPGVLASGPPPDLVVGFDIDGFRWASARPADLPYIVCLKGIAADESRFERSWAQRLRLRLLARLERRNARSADRVLVPSRYSAEVAAGLYRVPPERLAVVPEAVDLARLRELRGDADAAGRGSSGGARLLSVAHQYPRKDTATLLRAMPRVLTRHPDTHLRVIGGGPELPRLRSLARRLELGASVRLEGPVEDDAAVQRAYAQADLFCLPSLQEGFGIVFVEAMSASLPVVAARAGAVPEVVRDGETGVLVPPGEPDALAEAIIRLLDRPDERRTMGEAGRRAAAAYDLDRVGDRFMDVVGPLLASGAPL